MSSTLITLSPTRALQLTWDEKTPRFRDATFLDTPESKASETVKALAHLSGDISVDTKGNVVQVGYVAVPVNGTVDAPVNGVQVNVYNADGSCLSSTYFAGCVDYYNMGKWVEMHFQRVGEIRHTDGVYGYDGNTFRVLTQDEFHTLHT